MLLINPISQDVNIAVQLRSDKNPHINKMLRKVKEFDKMRKSPFALILLLVGLSASSVIAQTFRAKTFEDRKEQIRDYYADSVNISYSPKAPDYARPNFDIIAAKLAAGRDVPMAISALDTVMSHPAGNMFYIYELMGAYLFGKKSLAEDFGDKVRNNLEITTIYRGDTENHWLQYYTGWYLASQEWDVPRWSNGKSSEENLKESTSYIDHWIALTTSLGQGEFNSPTYIITYVDPLVLLYQFAKDPLMRKKAKMILEYIFADFGIEYLNGSYCGAHSRDYPYIVVNPHEAQSAIFGYLYFGHTEFKPKVRESISVIFPALSSFRIPKVIHDIATDRSRPYVEKERKRVRFIIRYGTKRTPAVYKYTFMTRDYCLSSSQGGILQPIQEHVWDVTFASQKPYNTVFSVNPYCSPLELGLFFPEEALPIYGFVAHSHGYYGDVNKWSTSSPHERTFQHLNTIIDLYDLDLNPTERWHQIDTFFPLSLDQFIIDDSGWIFGRMDSAYFAYYPLQKYRLEKDTADLDLLGGKPSLSGLDRLEKNAVDMRMRSFATANGCVLQAGSAAQYGSFDNFIQLVKKTRVIFDNKKISVKYRTINGDRLFFRYSNDRELNGKKIILDYPLFDSKYLQSAVGSKVLKISYRGVERTLDFNNFTETQQIHK